MKRHVLITGASGFLGGHLIAELRRHDRVGEIVAIDRAGAGPDAAIRLAELTDPPSVREAISGFPPGIVFHLASPPPRASLETLLRTNVIGTRDLLELLAEREPRPLVLIAGSAAEYGAVGPGESPVKEWNPLRPLAPYGISKAAQTMTAFAEGRRLGIPVIVFRPFNIIGPGMPGHLAFGSFARQVAEQESGGGDGVIRTGSLNGRRDFIDVRDVAVALYHLARSGRAGEIYNICSGSLRSMREGLDILIGNSRVEIRVEEKGACDRKDETPDFSGDPSKIMEETSWRPAISFARSLEDLSISIIQKIV